MSAKKSNNQSSQTLDNRPIAIYTRVSTYRQQVEGISLDAQLAVCEAAAILHMPDAKIVRFADTGSAKNANRSEYQAFAADVRRGRFRMVIAYSPDRLCRNQGDFNKLLSSLEQSKTEIYIHSLGMCSLNPAGKLVLQIMSCFGEFESAQISERTKSAFDHFKRINRRGPGRRPFGWDVDNHDNLIINKSEQAIINLVNSMRRAGTSWDKIASHLNTTTIRPVSSANWTAQKIRQSVMSANSRNEVQAEIELKTLEKNPTDPHLLIL